eukprot:GHVU01155588.1.p1 GENE.GHVU01155588.1~~GHVU01155588.1.p1  ORF type:complete len:330 (-),score=28.01 GHVU01155588.1:1619-2608(-)
MNFIVFFASSFLVLCHVAIFPVASQPYAPNFVRDKGAFTHQYWLQGVKECGQQLVGARSEVKLKWPDPNVASAFHACMRLEEDIRHLPGCSTRPHIGQLLFAADSSGRRVLISSNNITKETAGAWSCATVSPCDYWPALNRAKASAPDPADAVLEVEYVVDGIGGSGAQVKASVGYHHVVALIPPRPPYQYVPNDADYLLGGAESETAVGWYSAEQSNKTDRCTVHSETALQSGTGLTRTVRYVAPIKGEDMYPRCVSAATEPHSQAATFIYPSNDTLFDLTYKVQMKTVSSCSGTGILSGAATGITTASPGLTSLALLSAFVASEHAW